MADTLDSGSSEGNFMQVQVLSPAPYEKALTLNTLMLFFRLWYIESIETKI